jgi:MFS family permease
LTTPAGLTFSVLVPGLRGRRRSSGSRAPLPVGFGTIWSTVAIDLVGFGIILPLLPQYAEKLGATPAVVGAIGASFSVAQLAFAPVWGRLSDRIGRKPILVISLFGTAVGSLLTGVAGSVWLLFLGRVVDGASGASVSVAQAAASDLAAPSQRPRLMGLLGAAFGVGFVAGPAIGALGALGGVHVPFLIAAAISFVNALIAIRRLPETAPSKRGTGAAAADAQRIAVAPSLDGPGLVEPAHLQRPHRPPAKADVRVIARLVTISFLAMIAFSGFEITFPLLLEHRFGYQLAATGGVFVAIGLGLVLVQGGLVHPITSALGETLTLQAALLANAIGLVLVAVDGGWFTLVPALVLLVVGQGLASPTLSSAVAGRAGDQQGQWLGWHQSASGLARVIGPLVAGLLFQAAGVGVPYVVGAVLVAAALVALPVRSLGLSRGTGSGTVVVTEG